MNDSLPPLPVTADDDDDDVRNSVGVHGGDGEEERGGLGTLFGHPYGALPYGNIHLATPQPSINDINDGTSNNKPWHPDQTRHRGLGALSILNDEQLLSILSYIDGSTLGNGLVVSSRFLYVAGHHEELWRDLVLRRWGDSGFDVRVRRGERNVEKTDEKANRQRNSGCWKDIYAYNHHLWSMKQSQSKSAQPPMLHTPISISGIYSDTFFRSWLCRSFALQPSWLSTHTVATVSHSDLTTPKFIKDYEETNTPLLIKGASSNWPALQKWKDTNYLLKVTDGKSFRATSGAAPLPAQFTLSNYINYCDSSTEEAPLYLFDRTFCTKCPQLLEDFDEGMKESCPFWSRGNEEAGHDLFSVLGEERRPDYQWLIVGPKRYVSMF